MQDNTVSVDSSQSPARPAFAPVFNVAVPFIDRHLDEGRAGKVAIRCAEGDVTYGDLAANVNRAGNALHGLGLAAGDRVVMAVKDCPAFFYVFWGAIKAGYVPVPVNTLLRANDYRFILQNSGCAAALYSPEFAAEMEPALAGAKPGPAHRLATEGGGGSFAALMEAAAATLDAAPATAESDCFWLYTSGSTGTPKGGVHAHRDMVVTSQYYGVETLGAAADDIHFSAAKLFFAYGLGNALTFPMPDAARSVLLPEWPTPARVFAMLERHRPTIFYAVPTLFNGLLHALEDWETGRAEPPEGVTLPPRLGSLRFCISAGESLPASLYHRWRERFGCEILDGIGSTENLHDFIANRPGKARPGSSGQVVPGYRAKIVDEHGDEVADGEVGALWIRGGSAASHYWNRRDKTRETMRGPWLVTGDQYHRDADGTYWHHGRNDDMLKVSGSWVSPVEVEGALATHPAVAECAVVGRTDEDGLTKPHAFVVPRAGHEPADGHAEELAEVLRAHLHEKIAGYKVPRWVDFVTELPKTATGKIRRFELRG